MQTCVCINEQALPVCAAEEGAHLRLASKLSLEKNRLHEYSRQTGCKAMFITRSAPLRTSTVRGFAGKDTLFHSA